MGLMFSLCGDAMVDLTHSTSCCIAHPQAVSEMLEGLRTIDDRILGFAHHRSIALIFQIDHHWSLLFGIVDSQKVRWIHYDGLIHASIFGALRLSQGVAALLGLQSIAFDRQCLFSQHDDTTCGTIAILHLAFALGLRGHLSSVSLVVCTICFAAGITKLLGSLPVMHPPIPWMLMLISPHVGSRLRALLDFRIEPCGRPCKIWWGPLILDHVL